jgi:hypothetical protein
MHEVEQVELSEPTAGWWTPSVDRALEDRALKRALERARGAPERPSAAWALEELRADLAVAPDGQLERPGLPGTPLGDAEVAEALARYAALNQALADRLRRAGLGEPQVRRGLAPAADYARQLEAIRGYHREMLGQGA